jgi:hypothetical protein
MHARGKAISSVCQSVVGTILLETREHNESIEIVEKTDLMMLQIVW